ncbi:class I SAM-dependent methyltransferase [Hamadaea sp. NPDC051192]|uniref:class I SAM-dependent methyltransferase n=1 Tax=Hamadaea sp. NPDC051192 TaxID=3154940 RepID=UPI003430A5F6
MGIDPGLSGVPETALWTLYHRVREARRPDTVLPDPMAVHLIEQFDYPFEARFGVGFPVQPQIMALRARTFDDEVRRFLGLHPGGQVVALGEGLETTYWRVGDPQVRWLSVDLPPMVELRRRLLPQEDRQRLWAGSALDGAWLDEVDPAQGILVTAQGLMMYLRPEEAEGLLVTVAERFPGGRMIFDAITPAIDQQVVRHIRGRSAFEPPPLHWFVGPQDLPRLRALSPAISDVREVQPRVGRGLAGWLAPRLKRIPGLSRRRPMIIVVDF